MKKPHDRPVLTKKHLDRQIERIADETPTERVSVIVQMQSADDLNSYLEASSDAIRQRLSVVSARALVPPSRDSINTDAHHPDHLGLYFYGIATARRAWITAADVINTWELPELMQWLENRRRD